MTNQQVRAVSTPCPLRLGWIPDVPDARDYSCRHARVTPLLMRLNWSPAIRVPDEVDLQSDDEGEYFRPVEDQGDLNSSAAFAVLSLVEYFERRVRGHTFDGSKRFLYRITSHMSQRPGGAVSRKLADVGVELRTTFKALNQFGVVPEQYYPYFPSRFDEEPSQFIYGLAKVPDRLLYFRLDEANQDGLATWRMLESFLAAGFPVVFGFSVPGSLSRSAEIPYRPQLDTVFGGQAAVAIGYRKHHFGRGQHALRIRCSWGRSWGENGNGWLPVSFIYKQLAKDFWTCVSESWFVDENGLQKERSPVELTRPSVLSVQDRSE